MAADTDYAIELKELTHYYGSFAAVDGLSFKVPRGQVLGLLGPNGAGKTTTVKMLTTLLPPSSGTAFIDSYDIVKQPSKIRKIIGYVPQLLSADGDLTGYENLLLSAKLYGLDAAQRKTKIHAILDFMGLLEFQDTLVNEYSGGMIRRLEIAQALIHDPQVLFFDEPTVGLDPGARKSLWKNIQDLRRNFGTTLLMTTHDMDEADRLCDIVAFMHNGRIMAMGPPKDLKALLGPGATLDDVFIHYTGASITEEGGDFRNVKQIRKTIRGLE